MIGGVATMAKKLVAGQDAIAELSRLDPVLADLLEQIEPIEITLQEDLFVSLASAIVGQQLSNRVAEVLWERLVSIAQEPLSPKTLLSMEEESLRTIGISYSKIKYLQALSSALMDGSLDLDRLHLLEDDEIIAQLTSVKGIGPWTAEMFLIFSLGRIDVFSAGDGGLQRAVKWLYQLDQTPGIEEMKRISRRWKPYRTIAALYLWRAIDDKMI
jgi:DNA-3-methyladenine glycosylase II